MPFILTSRKANFVQGIGYKLQCMLVTVVVSAYLLLKVLNDCLSFLSRMSNPPLGW
jgi:hypothetical protein